jgi:hypothetical protein
VVLLPAAQKAKVDVVAAMLWQPLGAFLQRTAKVLQRTAKVHNWWVYWVGWRVYLVEQGCSSKDRFIFKGHQALNLRLHPKAS